MGRGFRDFLAHVWSDFKTSSSLSMSWRRDCQSSLTNESILWINKGTEINQKLDESSVGSILEPIFWNNLLYIIRWVNTEINPLDHEHQSCVRASKDEFQSVSSVNPIGSSSPLKISCAGSKLWRRWWLCGDSVQQAKPNTEPYLLRLEAARLSLEVEAPPASPPPCHAHLFKRFLLLLLQ